MIARDLDGIVPICMSTEGCLGQSMSMVAHQRHALMRAELKGEVAQHGDGLPWIAKTHLVEHSALPIQCPSETAPRALKACVLQQCHYAKLVTDPATR